MHQQGLHAIWSVCVFVSTCQSVYTKSAFTQIYSLKASMRASTVRMCLIASCPVVDAIVAVVQVIITLDNVDVVAANKSLILVHDNYIYPHTCMHVQKHCYAILLM